MSVIDPLASIRRFFGAENTFFREPVEQRDIVSVLAELDPEVVIDLPRSLPQGGIWRGHSGFTDLFGVVDAAWSTFEVRYPAEGWYRLGDHRVLAEGGLYGVLRDSGAEIDQPVLSVFSFSSRGIVRLDHFYKDTAGVVAAIAGAPEA